MLPSSFVGAHLDHCLSVRELGGFAEGENNWHWEKVWNHDDETSSEGHGNV